ncbi:hypothetical protein EVAR_40042_1 [Eumeta japonica]|uniref:Uncharacterized protein n=1 Tax=Eumeta variegata TaxID=151549 RepID=A0A4C1W8E1_EUMVA|nr:hypothetical protein EVAR_40042_1 [Eumeta japonica]
MATPPQLKSMQLIFVGGCAIYKMQLDWCIRRNCTSTAINEARLKYRSLDRLKKLSIICPPHRKKSVHPKPVMDNPGIALLRSTWLQHENGPASTIKPRSLPKWKQQLVWCFLVIGKFPVAILHILHFPSDNILAKVGNVLIISGFRSVAWATLIL